MHGDLDQGVCVEEPRLHRPVLLTEAIEALSIRPDGVYLDGTFGRGGHSRLILQALGPGGRLLALDRDPEAVAAGQAMAAEMKDARFEIVHQRFSVFDQVLDARGIDRVDGVLLDLGVSSPQLDDPSRGFSFSQEGPLDMRMDPTQGMSARDWLLKASVEDITEVLKRDGDERFAFPIAKEIVARREQTGGASLQTTRQLADLVAGVIRRRQKNATGKNPATRTFQAVRIHTNHEGDELARGLNLALARLKPGGRLAVISFHSNEDRVVKQFMARHSGRDGQRHPITGKPLATPLLQRLGRILPSDAEVAANPRARSSVLRVAERLPTPLTGTE
ncbi:MAG: 16S rRNA (cytosine(1402)-N(4))-methyltransferase RsmH [Lautropia sp.]|nr:16S rRNA (cytosine(1402)-N(4))-methyltransferase RsmH [Lautropia sp.]